MKNLYRVWADSESDVVVPLDVVTDYDNLEQAYDVACELAHEHDGEDYMAIFHVEDLLNEETIETIENIRQGDGFPL